MSDNINEINTEGGSSVHGNVSAGKNFIGRDQINIYHPSSPSEVPQPSKENSDNEQSDFPKKKSLPLKQASPIFKWSNLGEYAFEMLFAFGILIFSVNSVARAIDNYTKLQAGSAGINEQKVTIDTTALLFSLAGLVLSIMWIIYSTKIVWYSFKLRKLGEEVTGEIYRVGEHSHKHGTSYYLAFKFVPQHANKMFRIKQFISKDIYDYLSLLSSNKEVQIRYLRENPTICRALLDEDEDE